MALIFALARGLGDYHRRVAGGEWAACGEFSLRGAPIEDVRGKQIGIVGAGNLGRATARLACAVGMRAKFLAREANRADGGETPRIGLDELLATSDVISLHCPLDAANRGMFGAREFARMKPGARC